MHFRYSVENSRTYRRGSMRLRINQVLDEVETLAGAWCWGLMVPYSQWRCLDLLFPERSLSLVAKEENLTNTVMIL